MLEIVLIRPGATDYDQQHRLQGTLNIPLNEEGKQEVARTLEELRGRKLEILYTSDSEPSVESAAMLAKALGVKLKRLDDMQNLDHGLWQGMMIDEIKRKHPRVYRQWQEQPDGICPPEGEMLHAARARVEACLKRLFKKHRTGTVGLVIPEPLASVVQSRLEQGALGDLWKAPDDHGSWDTISVEPAALLHAG